MTANIRIALADDHHLIRSGLKLLLGSSESLEIVGEASDGASALALAEQLQPDILLLDLFERTPLELLEQFECRDELAPPARKWISALEDLMISLEVPKTFSQILELSDELIAFAVTIIPLFIIWQQHRKIGRAHV